MVIMSRLRNLQRLFRCWAVRLRPWNFRVFQARRDSSRERRATSRSDSLAFLLAALQLMSITVERNSANEQAFANDLLPPVMPHELVKYMQSQFYAIVRKHILQLQAAKFTPQQIEDIEEEHGKLIRCYHAEENLKLAINVCDHKASLRSNPALQQWKQISPGWGGRHNFSDFGLECVLHAQQHKELLKCCSLYGVYIVPLSCH